MCGHPFDTDATRVPDARAAGPAGPIPPAPLTPDKAAATPEIVTTPGSSARVADVYTAGTLLAQRYRIVGLLGKGGMGEVYRADDLTLGQSVALKFLPRALSNDPVRLGALIEEVRSARRVAHPNVCRVYDVGETPDPSAGGGQVRRFLTMEHVDGEDLATSLRRIGRFPVDKGLEIARQLCAGLSAVHEQGLLHRDLKPANVMLDGRGKVRITDFGLAGEELLGAGSSDQFAGTPAYMAPELLKGGTSTVQSDIYALGLVLYEVFTGKRAFDAGTIASLRQQQEQSRPASLSSSAGQIDPAIEEVIFRCLEANPSRRPSSAIGVAAALPGGDPLAAILAAGETPSPAMVAAAGEHKGLRPRVAVALLSAFFVLLAVCAGLIANDGFTRNVPLDFPPDVLASKADDMLRSFGYTEKPLDRVFGLRWYNDYTQYVNEQRKERDRWRPMREGQEPGVLFWYRASAAPLVARTFQAGSIDAGRVTPSDPPPVRSGDRGVWLDTKGRLIRFEAVPPEVETGGAAAFPAPDWSRLFAAAGIDSARFAPAQPTWNPLAMADARAAWTGTRPERPDVPLRIEAASWRGKPVSFRVIAPWTRPERQQAPTVTAGGKAGDAINIAIVLVLVVGGTLLARHNLALGRADRHGAIRLASFAFWLILLGWSLQTDHVASVQEVSLVIMGTSVALFSGGGVWLLYVALEPFVRRRWPHTVITWNRLLSGRFKDGMLGRDLLIGSVLGLTVVALFFAQLALARFLGPVDPEPVTPSLDPLLGARFVGSAFIAMLYNSIMGTLTTFSVLFIFLLLFRRLWITAVVFLAIVGVLAAVGSSTPVATVGFSLAGAAALLFVLLRYGLVAFAVENFVLSTLAGGFPVSVDPSRWYTGPSLVLFAGLIAVAVVGFRLSLGGEKVFGVALE